MNWLARLARWWRGPEHPCHRCRHFREAVVWPDPPTMWDGVELTGDYCAKHDRPTGPRDTCPQWEATTVRTW